jgi:hypothetical protein
MKLTIAPDAPTIVRNLYVVTHDEVAGALGAFTVVGRVPPYPFNGFVQPVDNEPVVNRLKAGVSVPVKFSLGGDRGLDIVAVNSPTSRIVSCQVGVAVGDVEQTATAGQSELSFDETTGLYTYVWKTDKSWAGQCREFTLTLADGTSHNAMFLFTR